MSSRRYAACHQPDLVWDKSSDPRQLSSKLCTAAHLSTAVSGLNLLTAVRFNVQYIKQRGYDLHSPEQYGQLLTDAGFADVKAEDRTWQVCIFT